MGLALKSPKDKSLKALVIPIELILLKLMFSHFKVTEVVFWLLSEESSSESSPLSSGSLGNGWLHAGGLDCALDVVGVCDVWNDVLSVFLPGLICSMREAAASIKGLCWIPTGAIFARLPLGLRFGD